VRDPAARSDDHGIFERLLDIWLPDGGLMATLAEFYADESYDEQRTTLFCVAGYLFEKQQAVRFQRLWRALLGRYCLTEFHMTDCANHQGEFGKLCKQQCIDAATEAISIIHETALYGFVTSVDIQDYDAIIKPLSIEGLTHYSFCLTNCLQSVAAWAKRNEFVGDIAYNFEQGYKHEADATNVMRELSHPHDSKRAFRIGAYGFVERKKALPIQAADIMAWHWFLETYRAGQKKRSHPVRKDLIALIRPQDMAADFTKEKLLEYREMLIRQNASSSGAR
jgi:hypothetical protein